MGKPTGFMEIERHDRGYEKAEARKKTWTEFVKPLPYAEVATQAARCMDCGIPFCHTGCPVNNMIPDWNNLVYREQWQTALETLHSTNNFPEFTGRICPGALRGVLHAQHRRQSGDHQDDRMRDRRPRLGRGLDSSLSRAEEDRQARRGDRLGPGGARLLAAIGARGARGDACSRRATASAGCCATAFPISRWRSGTSTAACARWKPKASSSAPASKWASISVKSLMESYDAIVMSCGAEAPRDLEVPGRELNGIHFAMDYLTQQNKRVAGDDEDRAAPRGTITAKDKHVIVIGGGDTGSDCIGTANRQGAASITQLEILPQPPEKENKALTWPDWPLKMRTSSSQEEGCDRDWAVLTKRAVGTKGRIEALECVRVEWVKDPRAVSR